MNVLETGTEFHLGSKLPLHSLDGFYHVHSALPRLDTPVSAILSFPAFPPLLPSPLIIDNRYLYWNIYRFHHYRSIELRRETYSHIRVPTVIERKREESVRINNQLQRKISFFFFSINQWFLVWVSRKEASRGRLYIYESWIDNDNR